MVVKTYFPFTYFKHTKFKMLPFIYVPSLEIVAFWHHFQNMYVWRRNFQTIFCGITVENEKNVSIAKLKQPGKEAGFLLVNLMRVEIER